MAVPFFSVDFRTPEWKAYLKALLTGHLREGGSVNALKNFLKARYPSHFITLLPSARMGFYLLLEELFQEGDEIIVPAMGFPLYVVLLLQQKLKPIFVDVEPRHYTIDYEKIRDAVTPNTKGILVTHLFGHPCQMEGILHISQQLGIPVIEDCAHSYNSFYKGQEAGTFGHAALLSCSVMKIPTTLGGGILLTPEQALHTRIQKRLDDPQYNYALKKFSRYYVFNFISILNSYPHIYSLLSHQVFGLIKKRNPQLLRKILYAGMGLENDFFLWERPKFSNYQAAIGLVQFKKSEKMTEGRREYAHILNEKLQDVKSLDIPCEEETDCRWNYQYYVVRVKNGIEQKVFHDMFRKGIHLMQEDVWDCTHYEFAKPYYRECLVASSHTPGLIRIQNNTLLRPKTISRIGDELRTSVLKESKHVS